MAKKQNTKQIKTNKINPDERQVEYWRGRAEREFLAGEKEALEVAKQLKQNYRTTMKEIEKEINSFYGKYASKEGITLEEAKQILDRIEKKSFKEYINDMIKMGKKENFTKPQINEFKKIYTKTRITRLEELQTEIKYHLHLLTNRNQKQIEQLLQNTYENQYYQSVFDVEQFRGYSSSFSGLDDNTINKAINTKWLGSNYTISLYKNEANLLTILNQEIPRGLTLGYNPRKLASQVVNKRLDNNYNNVVRLIRTEYNKVQNDASIDGYKAAGIKKYQILATLDSRTSDICREMNGEIYDVSDIEVGVNFPPFHPNCRTTTIAYFPPDEFDMMSDEELENYLQNLDTLEWLKGLVKHRNGKMEYKGGE